MSALHPIADILRHHLDVCFVPTADIASLVCYERGRQLRRG